MTDHEELVATRKAETTAWLKRLGSIADPLAVRLLELHSKGDAYQDCGGCDSDGWECEQPPWPCRTVQEIAEHFGCPAPEDIAGWLTETGRSMLADFPAVRTQA